MLAVASGPKDLTLLIADYYANIRAESFGINHLDYPAHLLFHMFPFFHKLHSNQSASFII
jgi:hypothetical protein